MIRRPATFLPVLATVATIVLTSPAAAPRAVADEIPTGAFAFAIRTTVPGTPADAFDAATGDITGWWDHSMSGHPLKMYVEPKPGGGFVEVFDASGDGVRHATVTYAKRGEKLRYEGPLGLAGNAIDMVTTWTFTAAGPDSVAVELSVHAAGEVHPGWPEVVEKTWRHFLQDRFTRWVSGGRQPLD